MNPSQTILLFGASGWAGGAVLQACLADPAVREVRAIVRRPLAVTHEKLRVFVHADFEDFDSLRHVFTGVDACLFCLGVSSTQLRGEAYRRVTRDITLAAARALKEASPGASFHYISGQGTRADSRMEWSRIKAQVESDLMALLPACAWRPSFIAATPSATAPVLFRVLAPCMRLFRGSRRFYVEGTDLGRAMLRAAREGLAGRVFENPEIRSLAAGHRSG